MSQEQQQQPNDQQQQSDAGGETPPTFESWLATAPDDVKALYEAHTNGLRSALNSERESKRELERQLREMRDKAEKGSEAETRLNEMVSALETANRRADFVIEAAKPENGVADIEAAWLIVNAKADTFFDRKGNVNFALLKQQHPMLFRAAKAPPGNAGSGVGQEGGKQDINDWIRSAAGRRR